MLVIDYVRQDLSKEGMRKVAAQEIGDVHTLRRLYDNTERRTEALLRVFHVQNAPWAVEFMLKKFYIKADELVGNSFGRYVDNGYPEKKRRGKPLLKSKTWQTQHDPWRGISKTAFSVDYLKSYRVRDPSTQSASDAQGKMMELNCYDDTNDDTPMYGWDICAQRLVCYFCYRTIVFGTNIFQSCYVQHKESAPNMPENSDDIRNPYEQQNGNNPKNNEYFPVLDSLDNGNVIIIFENSKTRSIRDTVISARQKWESRWRRLPFYLAYESHDISSDDQMASECMRLILQDIWKALAESWEHLLDISSHHVAILEEKIYEFPADESRADEIWFNSSNWLKTERLVFEHSNILKEVQLNLRELMDDNSTADNSTAETPWLEASTNDFERLQSRVDEDLVKPTNSLSDLMYKSVEIRDSRHSLELSYSMWRLSWITFIFLPLTFTVSFFGMNVDTFADDPDIKWFFISAVPLMVLVLISWYILKHQLARSRQTPYSRGLYEKLFTELATQYPRLWSRSGPRDYIVPRSRPQQFKWWLVRRWNEADRTIRNTLGAEDDQFDGLGSWSHLKRTLSRRWTAEISITDQLKTDPKKFEEGDGETVAEGIGEVTEMLHIPVQRRPLYNDQAMLRVPHDLDQRVSFVSATSHRASLGGGRPSSQGSSGGRNSGVMIEEQKPDWLQALN